MNPDAIILDSKNPLIAHVVPPGGGTKILGETEQKLRNLWVPACFPGMSVFTVIFSFQGQK